MGNKKIRKFQRALARYALYIFAWFFEHLPYRLVYLLGRFFMTVGYCFIVKQRRIARGSLQIAFGREKNPQEIDHIMRECFNNIGLGMLEMLYFLAHHSKVAEKVSWQGREHLDEALKLGRGIIAVTAHFGNFPLMMLHCALQGYQTNTIIRPARDEQLERYLFKKRNQCGLKTVYAIPRQECVQNSLRALRNNELLFIPLDQNFGAEAGVFVDFFGQKAATATGPIIFALRTQAPVLLMFIIRQKDNSHRIVVEPPLLLEEGRDEKEAVIFNTAKITKVIETYIRRYPQEWGWMHRRWKTRPGNV